MTGGENPARREPPENTPPVSDPADPQREDAPPAKDRAPVSEPPAPPGRDPVKNL